MNPTDRFLSLQLVERIRPHLASIRSTPYGKRIHSKIQREQQGSRYGNRQQLHYQSMPSLRASASATTTSTKATQRDPSPPYNPNAPSYLESMTPMAGLPLNYNIGTLGNSHALYPFP
jgi:hypothetical protein